MYLYKWGEGKIEYRDRKETRLIKIMAQNKMRISKSNFEHMPCNLCGSKDCHTLFIAKDWFFQLPGEFPVVKCKNCGLVYLNPRLTPEVIIDYYPQNYYTHKSLVYNKDSSDSSNTLKLITKIKERIKSLILNYYYEKKPRWKRPLVFFIVTLFWKRIHIKDRWGLIGESGRLLDIGCGNGVFLRRIEQDWLTGQKIDCFGVDTDKEAVKIALKGGLKVKEGTLENTAFPDNYFDVIRVHHVLEHIPNPLETLKEVHRVTKPGGKVIIEVPNFDSIGPKLLKDRWAGMDVPRHYFQFSPVTLKRMLVISSFQVLRITKWHGFFLRELSLKWMNKYWDSLGIKGFNRKIRFIGISILLQFLDRFYKGATFSIMAAKK